MLNSKDHYKKFSDIYGESPSDKDRPSCTPSPLPEAKEVDKGRRSLLVRGKVRGCISCHECSKPRCIYAAFKLTSSELREVSQIKASQLYTCGSVLFPPGSIHESNIVVREALVCAMYVEAQYYSSVLLHFPPVCYYCGIGEEALVDDEVKELKKCYAVVYPICFLCTSKGNTLTVSCHQMLPRRERHLNQTDKLLISFTNNDDC